MYIVFVYSMCIIQYVYSSDKKRSKQLIVMETDVRLSGKHCQACQKFPMVKCTEKYIIAVEKGIAMHCKGINYTLLDLQCSNNPDYFKCCMI